MTEQVQLALIVAVPPTIAAIAGVIISLRNGRKADAIHELANSQLTAVTTSLKEANKEIGALKKLVGTLQPKPK